MQIQVDEATLHLLEALARAKKVTVAELVRQLAVDAATPPTTAGLTGTKYRIRRICQD